MDMAEFDRRFERFDEHMAVATAALASAMRVGRSLRERLLALIPDEGEEMVALPKEAAARDAALLSYSVTLRRTLAASLKGEDVAESMVAAGEAAAEARMCLECGVKSRHGGHYCAECGEEPHCPNCARFFGQILQKPTGFKGSGLCHACHEKIHAKLNEAVTAEAEQRAAVVDGVPPAAREA